MASKYVSPVSGTWALKSSSPFGASRSGGGRLHAGNDLQAKNGSQAVAVIGGRVLYTGHNQGYQWNAVVLGDDGNAYRYATHGPLSVKEGARIEQGAAVGTIDRAHLHFEVIPKGSPALATMVKNPGQFVQTSWYPGRKAVTVDPAAFFGIKKGSQIVAGREVGSLDKMALVPEDKTGVMTPFGALNAKTGKLEGPQDRTLRRGMTGDDVSALQQRLADAGLYKGKIDGDYGRGTASAVSAYQGKMGLERDGLAGPETQRSLSATAPAGLNMAGYGPPGIVPTGRDLSVAANPPTIPNITSMDQTAKSLASGPPQPPMRPYSGAPLTPVEQGPDLANLSPPPIPQASPRRDPSGFPIDPYRPAMDNADGTFSTEETATLQAADGKWYNVPTIDEGRRLDPNEVESRFNAGTLAPVAGPFPTVGAAEQSAQARTDSIAGARSTALGPPRSAAPMPSFMPGQAAGTPLSGYEPYGLPGGTPLGPSPAQTMAAGTPLPSIGPPTAAGTPLAGYEPGQAAGTPLGGYEPYGPPGGTPLGPSPPMPMAGGTPTAGYEPQPFVSSDREYDPVMQGQAQMKNRLAELMNAPPQPWAPPPSRFADQTQDTPIGAGVTMPPPFSDRSMMTARQPDFSIAEPGPQLTLPPAIPYYADEGFDPSLAGNPMPPPVAQQGGTPTAGYEPPTTISEPSRAVAGTPQSTQQATSVFPEQNLFTDIGNMFGGTAATATPPPQVGAPPSFLNDFQTYPNSQDYIDRSGKSDSLGPAKPMGSSSIPSSAMYADAGAAMQPSTMSDAIQMPGGGSNFTPPEQAMNPTPVQPGGSFSIPQFGVPPIAPTAPEQQAGVTRPSFGPEGVPFNLTQPPTPSLGLAGGGQSVMPLPTPQAVSPMPQMGPQSVGGFNAPTQQQGGFLSRLFGGGQGGGGLFGGGGFPSFGGPPVFNQQGTQSQSNLTGGQFSYGTGSQGQNVVQSADGRTWTEMPGGGYAQSLW